MAKSAAAEYFSNLDANSAVAPSVTPSVTPIESGAPKQSAASQYFGSLGASSQQPQPVEQQSPSLASTSNTTDTSKQSIQGAASSGDFFKAGLEKGTPGVGGASSALLGLYGAAKGTGVINKVSTGLDYAFAPEHSLYAQTLGKDKDFSNPSVPDILANIAGQMTSATAGLLVPGAGEVNAGMVGTNVLRQAAALAKRVPAALIKTVPSGVGGAAAGLAAPYAVQQLSGVLPQETKDWFGKQDPQTQGDIMNIINTAAGMAGGHLANKVAEASLPYADKRRNVQDWASTQLGMQTTKQAAEQSTVNNSIMPDDMKALIAEPNEPTQTNTALEEALTTGVTTGERPSAQANVTAAQDLLSNKNALLGMSAKLRNDVLELPTADGTKIGALNIKLNDQELKQAHANDSQIPEEDLYTENTAMKSLPGVDIEYSPDRTLKITHNADADPIQAAITNLALNKNLATQNRAVFRNIVSEDHSPDVVKNLQDATDQQLAVTQSTLDKASKTIDPISGQPAIYSVLQKLEIAPKDVITENGTVDSGKVIEAVQGGTTALDKVLNTKEYQPIKQDIRRVTFDNIGHLTPEGLYGDVLDKLGLSEEPGQNLLQISANPASDMKAITNSSQKFGSDTEQGVARILGEVANPTSELDKTPGSVENQITSGRGFLNEISNVVTEGKGNNPTGYLSKQIKDIGKNPNNAVNLAHLFGVLKNVTSGKTGNGGLGLSNLSHVWDSLGGKMLNRGATALANQKILEARKMGQDLDPKDAFIQSRREMDNALKATTTFRQENGDNTKLIKNNNFTHLATELGRTIADNQKMYKPLKDQWQISKESRFDKLNEDLANIPLNNMNIKHMFERLAVLNKVYHYNPNIDKRPLENDIKWTKAKINEAIDNHFVDNPEHASKIKNSLSGAAEIIGGVKSVEDKHKALYQGSAGQSEATTAAGDFLKMRHSLPFNMEALSNKMNILLNDPNFIYKDSPEFNEAREAAEGLRNNTKRLSNTYLEEQARRGNSSQSIEDRDTSNFEVLHPERSNLVTVANQGVKELTPEEQQVGLPNIVNKYLPKIGKTADLVRSVISRDPELNQIKSGMDKSIPKISEDSMFDTSEKGFAPWRLYATLVNRLKANDGSIDKDAKPLIKKELTDRLNNNIQSHIEDGIAEKLRRGDVNAAASWFETQVHQFRENAKKYTDSSGGYGKDVLPLLSNKVKAQFGLDDAGKFNGSGDYQLAIDALKAPLAQQWVGSILKSSNPITDLVAKRQALINIENNIRGQLPELLNKRGKDLIDVRNVNDFANHFKPSLAKGNVSVYNIIKQVPLVNKLLGVVNFFAGIPHSTTEGLSVKQQKALILQKLAKGIANPNETNINAIRDFYEEKTRIPTKKSRGANTTMIGGTVGNSLR